MFPINFNWKFAWVGTLLVLVTGGVANLKMHVPIIESILFSCCAMTVYMLWWKYQKPDVRMFDWNCWFSAISGAIISGLLLWLWV